MDAKEAVHSVEHAASHARGSVVELATQALKLVNSLRAMHASDAVDSVLGRVGLQRRESLSHFVLVPVGIFVAGAAVGGIVGLALAPSTGKKLRKRVAKMMWTEIDAAEEQASKVVETVHDMLGDETSKPRASNGRKHA